jgi:hypothetical protein
MRRLRPLLAVALLASAIAVAYSVVLTHETLVLTTATSLPQTPSRTAVEIQNLGPNPIYCSVGDSAAAVVGKARMVEANGGKWALRVGAEVPIYCIASANQVTGAATVTTELR